MGCKSGGVISLEAQCISSRVCGFIPFVTPSKCVNHNIHHACPWRARSLNFVKNHAPMEGKNGNGWAGVWGLSKQCAPILLGYVIKIQKDFTIFCVFGWFLQKCVSIYVIQQVFLAKLHVNCMLLAITHNHHLLLLIFRRFYSDNWNTILWFIDNMNSYRKYPDVFLETEFYDTKDLKYR